VRRAALEERDRRDHHTDTVSRTSAAASPADQYRPGGVRADHQPLAVQRSAASAGELRNSVTAANRVKRDDAGLRRRPRDREHEERVGEQRPSRADVGEQTARSGEA
jgi:hypothetical protein